MRLAFWRRRRPPSPVYEYRLSCDGEHWHLYELGWSRHIYPERIAAWYRLAEASFAEHGYDVRDAWWSCERREATVG